MNIYALLFFDNGDIALPINNLTCMKEYAYIAPATEVTTQVPISTVNGTMSPTGWKDRLMSWGGETITYDACGNMLTRGNRSYSWAEGRKLTDAAIGSSIAVHYDYGYNGMRCKKTVNGAESSYWYAGTLLTSMEVPAASGTRQVTFGYDSAGQVMVMYAEGVRYYYVRNAQNDITGLVDETGAVVVHYSYDSWGNSVSTSGSQASTAGKWNPFRYRGYFYDEETGMYYLQSRYYDPEIRRFICADSMEALGLSPLRVGDKNLYAYGGNNPTNRIDNDGLFAFPIHLVIGAAVGAVTQYVVDVASNMASGMSLPESLKPDWVSIGSGAVSGLLAATGISRFGASLANAAISGASYIIDSEIQGEPGNWTEFGMAALAGAVAGYAGGEGVDGKNLTGIWNTSKSTLRTARSPHKIAMYSAKIVGVKNQVLKGFKGIVKSAFWGKAGQRLSDFIRTRWLRPC